MWPRRSHTLAPSTRITSNKIKFKCAKIKQYPSGEIKQIVDRDNLLTYPDFNKTFKSTPILVVSNSERSSARKPNQSLYVVENLLITNKVIQ